MITTYAGRAPGGGKPRLGPLQQATEHPHAVKPETAVRRIPNVRFGHTAVQPELVALCDPIGLCQDEQALVELMERGGANRALQVIQG